MDDQKIVAVLILLAILALAAIGCLWFWIASLREDARFYKRLARFDGERARVAEAQRDELAEKLARLRAALDDEGKGVA